MTRPWIPPWLDGRFTEALRPWQVGLVRAGVGPNDRVLLYLPRSPAWVEACLAVWSLGAAVVPIDPRWPSARCDTVARRTGAAVVVGRPLAGLTRAGPVAGPLSPPVPWSAERVAWICFTSGSSGRPKGVVVDWRGVPNLVVAQRTAFGLREGDRVGWVLSPGFDATFSDVLTALDCGRVPRCGPPGVLADPTRLVAWLAREGVACIDLPPSLLPHLDPHTLPPTLHTVVVGGEVARAEAIRGWARVLRVVSVYGPTEATVCTHIAPVDPDVWIEGGLGDPIPGVSEAVVQGGLRSPPGQPGELWLAGDALARGYLDDAGETTARFVHHDLGDGPRRWYRTGDRVVRADGAVRFLGRMDRVTKVRGQLVALPEVEAALAGLPGVRAAVVWTDAGRLQAVVEADDRLDWRERVGALLPDWMVPTQVRTVARLPRGTNGKPDLAAVRSLSGGEVPPLLDLRSPAERLAAIWSEVLARPVGPDDDLRTAGRDSLSVLEVHARLAACGLARPLSVVAELPTPRAMVDAVLSGHATADLEHRLLSTLWTPAPVGPPGGDRVLLLGGTGTLGAAVLSSWLTRAGAAPVTALVRADGAAHARKRVEEALRGQGMEALPGPDRLQVVSCDLLRADLGLPPGAWSQLAESARMLVDLSGRVGRSTALETLWATNVAPVWTLANLSRAAGRIPVLHAGSLSVFVEQWPRAARAVVDGMALPAGGRLASAYAATKWAAERLWDHLPCGPVHVLRYGLLVDDRPLASARRPTQLDGVLQALATHGPPPALPAHAAVNLTPVRQAAEATVHAISRVLERPDAASSVQHVVQPRNATVSELMTVVRAVPRAASTSTHWASTLTDPSATAFLSTDVTFVPRPGAAALLPPPSDAEWAALLHRIVSQALSPAPLADST